MKHDFKTQIEGISEARRVLKVIKENGYYIGKVDDSVLNDAASSIAYLNFTKDLPSGEKMIPESELNRIGKNYSDALEKLQERIQQLEENLRLSNSALINSRSHFEGLRFGNDRLQSAYQICVTQISLNEELLKQ